MHYLEERKIVHGDLASRNILITSELTSKISDFGLSHKLYSAINHSVDNETKLPIRWFSPEALDEKSVSR